MGQKNESLPGPLFLNRSARPSEEKDVEDMENDPASENARLPGEKREVFLSRLLLSVLNELCKGDFSSDFIAMRDALAHEVDKSVRKGRVRPQRTS